MIERGRLLPLTVPRQLRFDSESFNSKQTSNILKVKFWVFSIIHARYTDSINLSRFVALCRQGSVTDVALARNLRGINTSLTHSYSLTKLFNEPKLVFLSASLISASMQGKI